MTNLTTDQRRQLLDEMVAPRVCIRCHATYTEQHNVGRLACREHFAGISGGRFLCCGSDGGGARSLDEFYQTVPCMRPEQRGCVRADHRTIAAPRCVEPDTVVLTRDVHQIFIPVVTPVFSGTSASVARYSKADYRRILDSS